MCSIRWKTVRCWHRDNHAARLNVRHEGLNVVLEEKPFAANCAVEISVQKQIVGDLQIPVRRNVLRKILIVGIKLKVVSNHYVLLDIHITPTEHTGVDVEISREQMVREFLRRRPYI